MRIADSRLGARAGRTERRGEGMYIAVREGARGAWQTRDARRREGRRSEARRSKGKAQGPPLRPRYVAVIASSCDAVGAAVSTPVAGEASEAEAEANCTARLLNAFGKAAHGGSGMHCSCGAAGRGGGGGSERGDGRRAARRTHRCGRRTGTRRAACATGGCGRARGRGRPGRQRTLRTGRRQMGAAPACALHRVRSRGAGGVGTHLSMYSRRRFAISSTRGRRSALSFAASRFSYRRRSQCGMYMSVGAASAYAASCAAGQCGARAGSGGDDVRGSRPGAARARRRAAARRRP